MNVDSIYHNLEIAFFVCKIQDFAINMWASTRENLSSVLRSTKVQTSLGIRADWSAPLLLAFRKVSYLSLIQAKIQCSS